MSSLRIQYFIEDDPVKYVIKASPDQSLRDLMKDISKRKNISLSICYFGDSIIDDPNLDKLREALIQKAKQNAQKNELKTEVKESKEQFEEMTQERDFYYDKLRRVEDFCQDHEEEQLIQNILSILYETDESLGFLPPEDDGN